MPQRGRAGSAGIGGNLERVGGQRRGCCAGGSRNHPMRGQTIRTAQQQMIGLDPLDPPASTVSPTAISQRFPLSVTAARPCPAVRTVPMKPSGG
ncbi:hypothetical protein, partial [Elstera litoralis]|uniref:hypothetical protein n=1 Tax=Elstera litoralis TaxID=552518 RepID=UPI0012ED21A1